MPPRLLFHTLPALGFLTLLALPLSAATLHVSPGGDDANDGSSPARALRTLQKAADIVEPGDTVPAGRVTTNSRNHNVRWDYDLYPVEQTAMESPHDIVADPLFVRVARDLREVDFSLSKGSPAITSGSQELPQPTDLMGKKRASSQTPDRGAFAH